MHAGYARVSSTRFPETSTSVSLVVLRDMSSVTTRACRGALPLGSKAPFAGSSRVTDTIRASLAIDGSARVSCTALASSVASSASNRRSSAGVDPDGPAAQPSAARMMRDNGPRRVRAKVHQPVVQMVLVRRRIP